MAKEELGGSGTKVQRIADALKAAIESGEYGPGDRLPGESALAAKFGVAVLTARQALKVLRTEGLVESKKGAGARVLAFRPIRRHGIQRVSRSQWGAGKSIWQADDDRPVTIDIRVDEAPAPHRIEHILDVPAGSDLCVRSRRYVLEGRPVMLATSYLPLDLVKDTPVMRVDTGEGGTYARLADLGHSPVHFREEVRGRLPSAQEAIDLEMPVERSVLKICRTAYDEAGRAIEVNEMTLDSAAYVLEYDYDADTGARTARPVPSGPDDA